MVNPYFTMEILNAQITAIDRVIVPTPDGFVHAQDITLFYEQITWGWTQDGVYYTHSWQAPS
jgi:type VI protein secretion system component Hcp